jgi:hypothetical protein
MMIWFWYYYDLMMIWFCSKLLCTFVLKTIICR